MQSKQFKNIFILIFSTILTTNLLFADPESGCEIDTNTLFLTGNNEVFYNTDTDIIVEIKANQQVPIEYLFKMFPFERVRFSKYCRAINYCLSGNLKNSINLVNK